MVDEEPVVIQCKPGESVNGTLTFPDAMNTFSATLRAVQSPTGASAYVQSGPNLFTGSIGSYTGVGRICDFTIDTSAINGSTGAINGESYGLKVSAGYTGVFQIKSVADVIINVVAEIE